MLFISGDISFADDDSNKKSLDEWSRQKQLFLVFYYPLNISRHEEVLRRMWILIGIIFDNHYTNDLGKNGLLNLKSLHKIK